MGAGKGTFRQVKVRKSWRETGRTAWRHLKGGVPRKEQSPAAGLRPGKETRMGRTEWVGGSDERRRGAAAWGGLQASERLQSPHCRRLKVTVVLSREVTWYGLVLKWRKQGDE